ncbi:MAG: TerB family tellurite resistance protein [Bacteroidales bacterium]|jgi:hypothetical protein|nr:TerB family tellurite resistance protein [Bacteroidales bacterium]
MSTLNELKKSILADGVIDAGEVKQLEKALYADGKIDSEEAEFLFDLNDAVSGKDNCKEWKELFVNAISSFLLDDENSPGEIDEDEAKWLLTKIQGDGNIDELEKALLQNLKNKAKSFPAILNL